MATVFEYNDYKAFVRDLVRAMPQRGRGQYRRIATHLRVHTTMVSHVFRGSKDLTPEQACRLASFLGLRDIDADFFLALVEWSRAGTNELRAAIERRLLELRNRHQQLEHRVPGARTLSPEERATFYSHWYYSAVRLAASLPDMSDVDAIALRLALPADLVRQVIAFLVSAGLLAPHQGGYRLAAKRTHLGAGSPLAAAHHRNWRIQAMSRYDTMTPRDFAFTSPISLSRDDFATVRELLVEAVENVTRIVEPSSCEALALLNIDWLEL